MSWTEQHILLCWVCSAVQFSGSLLRIYSIQQLGICSLLTLLLCRRVISLIIANSPSWEVLSSLGKSRKEAGCSVWSGSGRLNNIWKWSTAASSITAVAISSAPVSHGPSSLWEWVTFIVSSTVHMWLKCARAVSIERETAGGEAEVECPVEWRNERGK